MIRYRSHKQRWIPERNQWSGNGVRYGREEDLYSMLDVIADHIERYAECRDD